MKHALLFLTSLAVLSPAAQAEKLHEDGVYQIDVDFNEEDARREAVLWERTEDGARVLTVGISNGRWTRSARLRGEGCALQAEARVNDPTFSREMLFQLLRMNFDRLRAISQHSEIVSTVPRPEFGDSRRITRVRLFVNEPRGAQDSGIRFMLTCRLSTDGPVPGLEEINRALGDLGKVRPVPAPVVGGIPDVIRELDSVDSPIGVSTGECR